MTNRNRHLSNMNELENRLENVDIVTCPKCGYWVGKWGASFNENLEFICPKCNKRSQHEE